MEYKIKIYYLFGERLFCFKGDQICKSDYFMYEIIYFLNNLIIVRRYKVLNKELFVCLNVGVWMGKVGVMDVGNLNFKINFKQENELILYLIMNENIK